MPPRLPYYPRLQWVDVLRGLALAGMIIYHFIWDLSYFSYLAPGQVSQGGLRLFARIVAFSFLFLAGFSLFLAHRNGVAWKAFWQRFFMIAAVAFLISMITWWLLPDNFIYFGILHEIALTSLAGLLFLGTPVVINLLLAVAVFVLPAICQCLSGPWFWWTGLTADARPSFDYVPFFPWFAAGFLGLTAARIMRRHNRLQWLEGGIRIQWLFNGWLQWAGRHSLLVYLVHQPVLLGMLYLCTLVFPPSLATVLSEMENECQLACEQEIGRAVCERFCRCSFDAMERCGLLNLYIQGKIKATESSIAEIRSYCAYRSREQEN